MTRTLTVWVIVLGLILNGLYQTYLAVEFWSSSSLPWAALSFASGWGIWGLGGWSRYSTALLAIFSLAAWLDGTIQNYMRGMWPCLDNSRVPTASQHRAQANAK